MESCFRSGFCVLVLFVYVCIGEIGSVTGENRRPKNVQVAIRGKWSGTPLLLEAGELLSKERRDFFWEFIEVWHHAEKDDLDSCTAKGCTKIILKHASSLLSEQLASLFQFSLTLRSASPRLVLYRQLAEESLSSFPLVDESNSNLEVKETLETNENLETKKFDHLLVGANPKGPAGKCCWVDTGGALFFDVAELLLWLCGPTERAEDSFQQPELFDFDHIHFNSNIASPVGILYVALGTDCFKEFHVNLVQAAKEGNVKYVVRPVLPSGCEAKVGLCGAVGATNSLNLGGYGVELALKNMEYKAMDDSMIKKVIETTIWWCDVVIMERKPELISEIMAFRDYLLSSTISDTPDVWELKDLGHQTAQRIVHASDPIQSMQEINQNFRSVVSSLSRSKIPPSVIRKLLSTMPPPESNMIRIDFRSTHVHYLNNLEEDVMYKRWRSNLNEILMPVFPGQLRYIRKNLFHAVYVLDPATSCGLEVIEMIKSMYENSFPMRFGVIFYSANFIEKIEISGGDLQASATKDDSQVKEDVSSLIIRLFFYIKENRGTQSPFQFLSNVCAGPKANSPPQNLLLKLEKEQTFKEHAQDSSIFVFKLGLAKMQCCLLMNGLVYDSSEEVLMNAMNEELPRIQEQVYYGQISSHTDILDKFLSESGINRYSPQIVVNDKVKPRFISLASSILGGESVLKDVNYLHSPETIDDLKPVTHLLVNITSKKGLKLLREGIRFLIGGSKSARLGVLFIGSNNADLSSLLFVKAFEITVSMYSHKKKGLDFLDQLFTFYEHMYFPASPFTSESTPAFIDSICRFAEANGLSSEAYRSSLPHEYSAGEVRKHLNEVAQFLYRQLGMESDVNVVITNGRVIFPIDENTFLSHDLNLLESVELKHRIKHKKLLKK
ncbi:hypothetical protein LWI28_014868 [Acer negundo]|uniref:UDP-glucose:glycoprotein glucosyltransferase n=1 Tax=Acer negundo TaxID=4023 RepID=A0AAD5IU65_ACENE|nr:hypothetical protein LWI28_014868 [Acer negundo]